MPVSSTRQRDKFIAALQARLPDDIMRHSFSVAEMMASLAAERGVAQDEASTAGLLHDYCRAMTDSALLAAAEQYGLPISKVQRAKPVLLHGPVAAEQAAKDFGVDNEAVYDAIYWHSTGRSGYGKVGQLLYFADFAEPLRTHPEAEEARLILAAQGFPKALLFVAEKKLAFIRSQPWVDPITEAFHAWLKAEFG